MEANEVTVGAAIELAGLGRFQYMLAMKCIFIWMADAMEMMLLSFLIWELQPRQHNASLLGSVTFVGIFVGSIAYGMVSDRVGRRVCTLLVLLNLAAFGCASALAPSFALLVLLRSLVGVGVGGVPVSFALFCEFMPAQHRGKMLVLVERGAWALGAIAESLLAWLVLPRLGWRAFLALSAVPSFLACCLYPWLPDSPHFLICAGRLDEAAIQIAEVARVNGNLLPPDFKLAGVAPNDARGNIMRLFSRSMWAETLLIWLLWLTNVALYYGIVLISPGFLESRHENIFLGTMVSAVAELPGLVACMVMIDRIGRRATCALLMAFACGSLGLLCANLQAMPRPVASAAQLVARASLAGTFNALYVSTAEFYPTSIRSTGVGAASAASRIGGFVTPWIASLGTSGIDADARSFRLPLAIYTAMALVSTVLAMLLPFETNGVIMSDERPALKHERIPNGARRSDSQDRTADAVLCH
ncbi:Synaptic vesicle 2-related protein [Porphyridium purpureum]|uniref:Synaptic vesicle 2-related protein n=1 Tax=Porphyridium purpureum TaxID=35688 RepID=A0A5J4YWZ4_PORPP|nr:Synaptic vesicle 2-related protein [Porphyridium purpureum]|eukprot:POR9588..scf209_3